MTDTLAITSDMVGKYVRCRSGQKGYIFGITPEWAREKDCFRVIGYYQRRDYTWASVKWSLNGIYMDNNHHDCHIIALWEDEEPEASNPFEERTDFNMLALTKRIEELEHTVKFLSGFSKGADVRMDKIEDWISRVKDQLL